jgi:hypothetical protein
MIHLLNMARISDRKVFNKASRFFPLEIEPGLRGQECGVDSGMERDQA